MQGGRCGSNRSTAWQRTRCSTAASTELGVEARGCTGLGCQGCLTGLSCRRTPHPPPPASQSHTPPQAAARWECGGDATSQLRRSIPQRCCRMVPTAPWAAARQPGHHGVASPTQVTRTLCPGRTPPTTQTKGIETEGPGPLGAAPGRPGGAAAEHVQPGRNDRGQAVAAALRQHSRQTRWAGAGCRGSPRCSLRRRG